MVRYRGGQTLVILHVSNGLADNDNVPSAAPELAAFFRVPL
jgi:hypothetical protein